MEGGTEGDSGAADRALVGYRFDLFAVCWAAATLFHFAGNRPPPWVHQTGAWRVVGVCLGIAAIVALSASRRRNAFLMLCLLIPVSAWLEAPVVGNHWVLAAATSLAALGAAAVAGWRRTASFDWPVAFWNLFAPAARCTLLIAYAFAAFAKLNAGFFDPEVSCAVFYQDQLVRSWGLGALSVAGQAGLGTVAAVGAAATELSVALLLLFRRTRRVGVLLALGFHWVLALDFSQHFWDFSAVLFAGFLLFLDDAAIDALRRRWQGLRSGVRTPLRRVVAGLGLVVAALVTCAAFAPIRVLVVLLGHGAWVLMGTGVLVLVTLTVIRAAPLNGPASLRVRSAVLLVPVIVFVNGLTPYLELKTGFGWNMYSNLRTVDGYTNHFLLPRTLDVTGLQSDRVTIVEGSDKALSDMIGSDYELVYSEFREYAHAFPEQSVTYLRNGETIRAHPLRDDPAGKGGVSAISARLQSFRVVDASGAERCQAVFTPAR